MRLGVSAFHRDHADAVAAAEQVPVAQRVLGRSGARKPGGERRAAAGRARNKAAQTEQARAAEYTAAGNVIGGCHRPISSARLAPGPVAVR
jgi:hypothetical protein